MALIWIRVLGVHKPGVVGTLPTKYHFVVSALADMSFHTNLPS